MKEKVEKNELLDDEELMQFIILPLSYKEKKEKEEKIHETVNLAAQIQNRSQQLFALAGILAFTDKLIDMNMADKIRRVIEMTKVGLIIEEEKRQALAKAEEEKRQALAKIEAAKQQELAKAEEEKQQELAKAEEEKRQELAKAEEEKQQILAKVEAEKRELVVKMILKDYSTEEIASIMSDYSQEDIEAVRKAVTLAE